MLCKDFLIVLLKVSKRILLRYYYYVTIYTRGEFSRKCDHNNALTALVYIARGGVVDLHTDIFMRI